MRTENGRRVVGSLLLAVLLASAGCVGLLGPGPGGSSGATPDLPSGEEAAEAYRSVEGIQGTMVVREESNLSTGGGSVTFRYRTIPGTRKSYRNYESPSRLAGDVHVTNGTVRWEYDESEDRAVRNRLSGRPANDTGFAGLVRKTFDTLRDEDRSTTTVSALPTVPVAGGSSVSGGEVTTEGERTYRVSYRGTETVAGREAYAVRYVELGNDSRPTGDNVTIWYDAEYLYQLRLRATSTEGRVRTTFAVGFTEVAFDPGLDDRDFRFDPPASATVVNFSELHDHGDSDDGTESGSNGSASEAPDWNDYTDVAALRDAASRYVTIPDPTVPGRFSLWQPLLSDGGRDDWGVRFVYRNSTSRDLGQVAHLVVTVESGGRDPPRTNGTERVTVAGRRAHYGRHVDPPALGLSHAVWWRCDGRLYAVEGENRETVLSVARSIDCGGDGS